MRTRVKVCCIETPEAAALAIRHGADALGLVGPMPSGTGIIDLATAARLAGFLARRPILGLLLERPHDRARDGGVDVAANLGEVRGRLLEMREQDPHAGAAAERRRAGERLPHHAAERVDVGCG